MNEQTIEDNDGTVYIVTKQGVYCQGVIYVSQFLDRAIENAKLAAKNERDDYHSFEVSSHNFHEISDGDHVASITRRDDVIYVEMIGDENDRRNQKTLREGIQRLPRHGLSRCSKTSQRAREDH